MPSPERLAVDGVLTGARFVGIYTGASEWSNVKRQQLRWDVGGRTPSGVTATAEPVLFDVVGTVDGYTLAPSLSGAVTEFVPFHEGPLFSTVADLLSVEPAVEVVRG